MGNKALVKCLLENGADLHKIILGRYTALCYVSYINKSLIKTKYLNKIIKCFRQ